MLDFFGTIAITATMVVTIYAAISTLAIPRRRQLAVAIFLGTWIGLTVALGAAGEFADLRTFPLIGVMFAAPLVTTALLAFLVPAVRSALFALPMPLLIGLNAARLFGAFFLLLALDGRLGGPFPQSAGWGDVLTGFFALPVAWLAARAASERDWMIGLWNTFGALDLVVAGALGVMSANGSPLQLIQAGAGSAAIQQLPWALIPTVLVPFFLVTHGVVFAQLRARTHRAPRALASRPEPA